MHIKQEKLWLSYGVLELSCVLEEEYKNVFVYFQGSDGEFRCVIKENWKILVCV